MMNCYSSMNTQSSYCGYSAAAVSSARFAVIMDTALCAVSILIVFLGRLLVLGM